MAAWFAEADTDHDGFLERAEFRADAAASFTALDANHDGVIDTDEVDAYERNMVPEILRNRPSTPPSSSSQGGGPKLIGAAPYNLPAGPEPVTAADTALDQRIRRADFLTADDRRFDALDIRGTGRIAPADLPRTAVQGERHGDGGHWRKES